MALRVQGAVEPLAAMNPRVVKLQGYVGAEVSADVTIVPNPKYPFKITGTTTSTSPKFYHRLEKVEGKEEYVLSVRNMDNKPGSYSGSVNLITDSPYQRTISIAVYGRILSTPGQATTAPAAQQGGPATVQQVQPRKAPARP